MPHLWDTRVRREGQWPRVDGEDGALLGLSDPDARPDVHRSPAEASAVIGSGRARDGKEAFHGAPVGTPEVKSENLSDDDDSLQKQIRAAAKQALQVKQQRQER